VLRSPTSPRWARPLAVGGPARDGPPRSRGRRELVRARGYDGRRVAARMRELYAEGVDGDLSPRRGRGELAEVAKRRLRPVPHRHDRRRARHRGSTGTVGGRGLDGIDGTAVRIGVTERTRRLGPVGPSRTAVRVRRVGAHQGGGARTGRGVPGWQPVGWRIDNKGGAAAAAGGRDRAVAVAIGTGADTGMCLVARRWSRSVRRPRLYRPGTVRAGRPPGLAGVAVAVAPRCRLRAQVGHARGVRRRPSGRSGAVG